MLANRNFRFVKLRADLLPAEPRAGEALVNRLKERGLRMVVEKVEDEDAPIEVMAFGPDCAQGSLLGEPRLARPAASAAPGNARRWPRRLLPSRSRSKNPLTPRTDRLCS